MLHAHACTHLPLRSLDDQAWRWGQLVVWISTATLSSACLGCRPLLPASATGTVDTHSIVDPIRSHLDARCNYYEAEATTIDPDAKTVACAYTRPFRDAAAGVKREHTFTLDYDILIIAVCSRRAAHVHAFAPGGSHRGGGGGGYSTTAFALPCRSVQCPTPLAPRAWRSTAST